MMPTRVVQNGVCQSMLMPVTVPTWPACAAQSTRQFVHVMQPGGKSVMMAMPNGSTQFWMPPHESAQIPLGSTTPAKAGTFGVRSRSDVNLSGKQSTTAGMFRVMSAGNVTPSMPVCSPPAIAATPAAPSESGNVLQHIIECTYKCSPEKSVVKRKAVAPARNASRCKVGRRHLSHSPSSEVDMENPLDVLAAVALGIY